MTSVCFPIQDRERQATYVNDPLDRLNATALGYITTYSNAFMAAVSGAGVPVAGEGDVLALRRAMARYLIDTGIASYQGWLV